jgi:hypothetical protein
MIVGLNHHATRAGVSFGAYRCLVVLQIRVTELSRHATAGHVLSDRAHKYPASGLIYPARAEENTNMLFAQRPSGHD